MNQHFATEGAHSRSAPPYVACPASVDNLKDSLQLALDTHQGLPAAGHLPLPTPLSHQHPTLQPSPPTRRRWPRKTSKTRTRPTGMVKPTALIQALWFTLQSVLRLPLAPLAPQDTMTLASVLHTPVTDGGCWWAKPKRIATASFVDLLPHDRPGEGDVREPVRSGRRTTSWTRLLRHRRRRRRRRRRPSLPPDARPVDHSIRPDNIVLEGVCCGPAARFPSLSSWAKTSASPKSAHVRIDPDRGRRRRLIEGFDVGGRGGRLVGWSGGELVCGGGCVGAKRGSGCVGAKRGAAVLLARPPALMSVTTLRGGYRGELELDV